MFRNLKAKRLPLPSKDMVLSVLSGLLLSAAFPPHARGDLVFVALVPLLLAVRVSSPRRAARLGFVSGLVFWLIDVAWLWSLKDNGGPVALVGLGHIALSLWLALFPLLFALADAAAWRLAERCPRHIFAILLALVVEPAFWVGSEYLRGTLLTGFPWNPLAAAQYRSPALVHAASLAGAGAVSWLIVAINASLASTISRLLLPFRAKSRNADPNLLSPIAVGRWRIISLELFVALAVAVACWMRGLEAIGKQGGDAGSARFRAAIIQADHPSIFEDDAEASAAAYETLLSHTSLSAMASPDICVWSETILPGYVPTDKDTAALVREAVSALGGVPLLAGGVELRMRGKNDYDIFNSAFLFDARGIAATYRKRHLVPFGEYIPFESKLPILKRLAPAGFSCEPGDGTAVFEVRTPKGTFKVGSLICFEDAFPSLARTSVRDGADILATLANDSWFCGSSEAEQHLAQAVLRCIENGRPMMRATNRGVSALIDRHGRVTRRIGGEDGSAGFAIGDLPTGGPETPYSRFGDWLLHIPCAVALLAFLAGAPLVHR